MASFKSPPLIHGIVLVAGGAVGAGMFALPIASAGAGFVWAVLGLVLVWIMTYLASLVLLEVNSSFDAGASFDTLVTSRLGTHWARANNLAITFIMMILMYAYTTAGASIIEPLLSSYLASEEASSSIFNSRGVLSIFFALVISLIVWLGTNTVSRISAILLVAMIVAFVAANAGLALHIDLQLLALPLDSATNKLNFLWVTLPVFVTAFACAGLVPSLVKHYQTDLTKVTKSLFFGTLASLVIYVIWLSTTLGTLDQAALKQVVAAGGSTGDLVNGLQAVQVEEHSASKRLLNQALSVFSHFAIITSFLSIGLGLFHFIADRFAWGDQPIDKTKTLVLAFSPPIVMSFFAPFGFVSTIGYAGLAVVFSFFIVPVLMLKKQRQQNLDPKMNAATSSSLTSSSLKRSAIGPSNWVLNTLLFFSALIIALKLATIFSLLPIFS